MKQLKLTLSKILISLFIFSTNAVYAQEQSLISIDEALYVVWPPNNEAGTFYLSLTIDEKTNLYPRLGYITALTPISLVKRNDQLVYGEFTEKRYGSISKYYEFVGAPGIRGYIKGSSIKPIKELVLKNKLNLLDDNYNKLVTPIHPSDEIKIFNSANSKLIHSFSRSSLSFVTTNGKVSYKSINNNEKQPFLSVRFFQKLKKGSVQIRDGIISYAGNHNLYKLFNINHNPDIYITDRYEKSLSQKIKSIWDYWVNDYDENKLEKAMKKSCNSEVDLALEFKASAEIPAAILKLGGEAQGTIKYKFPKNYRYIANTFKENLTGKEIRLLKTIKCKQNSQRDWYAEHVVIAGVFDDDKDVNIFQDELLKFLKEYFETPIAGGTKQDREKMVRVKDLSKTKNKDYFTAFYLFDKFMEDHILDFNLKDENEKLLLKALFIEQLIGIPNK